LPGHDAFTVDKRFANWTAILIALTGSFVMYWIILATNTASDVWHHHHGHHIKSPGGGDDDIHE
jgi:hypothetical protein